jgi:hypothetical protein
MEFISVIILSLNYALRNKSLCNELKNVSV